MTRSKGRRILVTGTTRSTGSRLLARLAVERSVTHVVALDDDMPDLGGGSAEHAGGGLLRLLQEGRIDTVVHLGLTAEPVAAGGRFRMKEHNVIGTMRLLAALHHAPRLERLVLKSTTAVYGSGPADPAVWTETMTPTAAPSFGYGRDAVEVEDYVRAFSRRRPEVTVTVLRLANQVGPTVVNPLTRYFALPILPRVAGFDPRLQFLHEEDADEVLARSVLGPAVAGTFNIAGDGAVVLTQAARIAGRPTLPVPRLLVGATSELLRARLDFSPEQARFVQFGRVADTAAARCQLGFEASRTSLAAFEDFTRTRLSSPVTPARVAAAERVALDVVGRFSGTPSAPAGRAQDMLTFLRRRATGDYQVDDFGFDPDLVEHVLAPALRPLYRRWWRVEVNGIDNVPVEGAAVIVGNHGGALPFDALMVRQAVFDEHPRRRALRMLAADLAFTLPVVAPLARKGGATLACDEDAERLLGDGELVGVWPEGYKGLGKPYRHRYQLQRFGRGGFVEIALRAGAPIVPVCVIGGEEAYPIIADARPLARLFGLPYIPITPTFPLLGPLGVLPLPSKWHIEFCTPVATAHFGAEAAQDPLVVFELTDAVRDTMRSTLRRMLADRRGVFS